MHQLGMGTTGLEGEKADETILWLSHPGITTRSAEDTALVFDVLAEPRGNGKTPAPLRVGVADNFTADADVACVFETAVATVRTFGHPVVAASAPFDMPRFGDLRSIDMDRKTIAGRAFKAVDVLLLPTTATTVLTVEHATGKPQALSAANTMFANYFGLPAISVPCGFDSRGLPVGLQVVGRPSEEGIVLQLAMQFQSATAFTKAHPIP
jgi:aspartyl-tRNA(Asn)/glutamyl-tRNA(Gln) amidotransferase subunit A